MVLAVKFAVSYAIPDIPEWVEDEIAKVEYKRREAEKAEKVCFGLFTYYSFLHSFVLIRFNHIYLACPEKHRWSKVTSFLMKTATKNTSDLRKIDS